MAWEEFIPKDRNPENIGGGGYQPPYYPAYNPGIPPGQPDPNNPTYWLQQKMIDQGKLSPGGWLDTGNGRPIWVSDSTLTSPEWQQAGQKYGTSVFEVKNLLTPYDPKYVNLGEDEGFWEDPQRVNRYKNIIKAAPPDWKPPEWLDTKAVDEAYRYLQYRNAGKPASEWQRLPDDDPGREYLRSMNVPPAQFMLPGELKEYEQKQQQPGIKPVGWSQLPLGEQIALGIIAPQSEIQGRPESSKIAASAVRGAMNAAVTIPMFTLIGGVGGLIIGGPPGMIAGASGGMTLGKILSIPLGFYTARAAYLGEETKGDPILQLFDVLAVGPKRLWGMGGQLKDIGGGSFSKGLSEVVQDPEKAWAAYMAGEAKYSTWEADADVLNGLFKVMNFVDRANMKLIPGRPSMYGMLDVPLASDHQVWMMSKGIIKPVDLDMPRNKEALNWLREELIKRDLVNKAGKYFNSLENAVELPYDLLMFPREAREMIEEFKSLYGDTGLANDLVYESVLDLANPLGFGVGKVSTVVGKSVGTPDSIRFAHAADINTGSLLIDALPMGVQQLASAVTGLKGSGGPFKMLETYKSMARQGIWPADALMPTDMRLKYNQLQRSGINKNSIEIEGNLLKWTDNGLEKTFSASRAAGTIPDIEELSSFTRKIAGIDTTYGIKELAPSAEKGWFGRLASLTPASQAHLMLNLMHSQMATLMDAANGDVSKMETLWRQAAGIDAVKAGDLGEAILKSPAMRAVQDAIRSAVDSGDNLTNLMTEWNAGEQRRTLLYKVSKALQKNPGEIIEQLKTNPEVLSREINHVAPEMGTPEQIVDLFGVFTQDNPLPWHTGEMQARIMIGMADGMDTYLQQHFGLAPDHAVFRISKALKGVQSLILLGFNPAYFMNNWVNNVVTRAADGVFGYLTPRQIQEFMDRFGIVPPRIDEGIGAEGSIYGGTDAISEATRADDWIGKSHRAVSRVSGAVGVFTRLSGKIEKSESRQATVIAMKRYMGKAWKAGKGFRKLDPIVESTINQAAPGMARALYAAVEGGLNIGEIENAIYGEYVLPRVADIAYQVDAQLFPNLPGMASQMLNETGILDALQNELQNAQTAEDVDVAFLNVGERLEEFIERRAARDIVDRAEEMGNISRAERVPAILQVHGDLEILNAKHWINGRRRMEELYSRRDSIGKEQWGSEVRREFAYQDREWKRFYELETQTTAAIVEAMDGSSRTGQAYIDLMVSNHTLWGEFHREARVLRDTYFDGFGRRDGEDYGKYQIRRNLEYNTLLDTLDELYQTYADRVNSNQMRMDELFATGYASQTGWDIEAARRWRSDIRDVRADMVRLQREHRALVRDMDAEARDAAYAEFNPVYNQMIARMKQMEVDGAYDLLHLPRPEAQIDPNAAAVESVLPGEGEPAAEPAVEPMAEEAAGGEDNLFRIPIPIEPASKQDILDLAAQYYIPTATKDGKPMDTVVRNIIRKYQRLNEMTELEPSAPIESAGVDVIVAAFEAHANKWRTERAVRAVKRQLKVEEIFALADRQQREATLREAGYRSRAEIEGQIRGLAGMGETEAAATMALLDLRADRFAQKMGLEANQATRDAWYATRIADVPPESGGVISEGQIRKAPSLEQQLTGMDDFERLQKLFNMEPVRVDTTSMGAERASIIQSAKEAYATFANTSVTNRYDGREIIFRTRAIRKIISHTMKNLFDAKVVIELTDIVKNGVLLFTEQSRNPDIQDRGIYHHYGTRVIVDGEAAYVRVVIREQNGNLFYNSHVTLGKEIEEASSRALRSGSLKPADPRESFSKDILLNWIIKVNRESGGDGLFQQYEQLDLLDRITDAREQTRFVVVDAELIEKAVSRFGITTDARLAGYILPDGRMLDFTDTRNTSYVKRKMGHEGIDAVTQAKSVDAITEFCTRTGAIRFDLREQYGNVVYVQAFSGITDAQQQVLESLEPIRRVTWELADGQSVRIDGGYAETRPVEALRALNRYANGVFNNESWSNEDVVNRGKVMLWQGAKASVEFAEDGRAVIRALKGADVSSLVHEIGHVFRRDLDGRQLHTLAKLGGLRSAGEFKQLEEAFWDGTASAEESAKYRNVEELFARGWERYLAEGSAPTPALTSLFKQFTDWLLKIYRQIKGSAIDVDIRTQIDGVSLRDIFDDLLVEKPDRPLDLRDLVSKEVERIRIEGRSWRLSDADIRARAEKAVIGAVLSPFKSLEEAQVKKEDQAVYEALERVEEEPALNPWTAESLTVRGKTTTARGISDPNQSYQFQFKVVELEALTASNTWKGDRLELNPLYPAELQPRERSEAASVAQVDMIARGLVPDELLMDVRALDRGAPIVGADNAVESGNGRALALARAAEMYPEKYQAYRAQLMESLEGLGIDPKGVEGMKLPVLVRERLTETDRAAFAIEGNRPVAMRMNTMETALNDARAISDESLANLDVLENETIEQALKAKRNDWFVNRFLTELSGNERAELSNNGVINQVGIARLIHATFAKVYRGEAGERLLRAFSMSMDVNIKNLESALMASLPQVGRAEAMIAGGARAADLSISEDVSIAVDKLSNLRASGMSVENYLNQTSFLPDELTPVQKGMLQFFAEQRSAKPIRELLRKYAAMVDSQPDPNQMGLFGNVPQPTKEELLDAAIRTIDTEAGGTFAIPAGGIEAGIEAAGIEAAVPVDQLAQPESGGHSLRGGVQQGMGRGAEVGARSLGEVALAGQRLNETYQEGGYIPLAQAEPLDLGHTHVRPEAAPVEDWLRRVSLIAGEQRTYARRYAQWVLDGERGAKPKGSPLAKFTVTQIFADMLPEMRKAVAERNAIQRITEADPPAEGTYITPIYPLRIGHEIYHAGVYYNGELAAVASDTLKPGGHEGFTLLGNHPSDPNMLVYEVDGEIQYIDQANPQLYQQRGHIYTRVQKGQEDAFSTRADDLPLFSGVPMRVQGQVFAPRDVSQQLSLFDTQPDLAPRRIVEIAAVEAGRTSYTRVDAKDIAKIKKVIAANQGAEMTYRILDANGKVVGSGEDVNEVISPRLFQSSEMNYLPREKWYSEAESRKAFREVQAQAYAQKDTFLGDAKDVTNEIEGVTFPPEVEEKAVKVNEERAASKYMIRGYFSDVLRTTLIIDTPETGLRVVDAMRSKGYEIWTNPLSGRPDLENLYEDANQGYKHVVVKLVKGEGDAVVKELQMITAAMQKAKHDLGGHDIYEIVRSVDEIVIQGGVVPENVLELTQGLKSFSDALYSKALSLDLASDNFIADPTAIRAAISEAVGALPANLVASANDILYVLKQPNSASSYAPLWESFTSNLSAFMEKSTSSDSSIAQSDSENNVLYQETFDPAEPMGEVPLNGTPVTRPEGIALHELNSEQVRPMFERMRQEYKRAMAENRAFKFGNLDGDTQTQVRKWLKGTVQSDLASTKAGALAYGEQMRDASLLNYQKRYGVDNITELFFPYQFWYTRTMLGWARRMVDKPGWFAMYARLKRAQEEQEEKNQMPTRLRGKMRLAMPWLPEWTGRGIWSDPLKQIFPFAQFGQPVERFAQDKNMIDKRAEAILTEMVEEGRATYADAQTAKVNKEGALWKQAVTQAEAELDKNGNPANLVSMMMGPALWWTIPSHLAAGKPEKVGPFPITRTGQTIRTLGEGTFLQPATDLLGGALAGPEEFIKRRGGLSEFGEWGDYYIDRHLSNMAAEGVISAADAQLAMIERTGKIFEMAKQRVAYEQMIRTPMVLPLLAMKEKASPGEIFAAALSSIFPGGLFPEGELKQRGLKVEFDQAYKQFKAGDMDALNGFFDEHPEYEARLALWDEPEERLRQFLINAVWDGYYGLEHPNRKLAVRQLGPEFERFLDKETRNEQGMDVQLLAYWAQTFKEMRLPNVAELEGMQKPEPLALYPSEMEQKIMAYQQEREAMFPNYYALQSNYYALPQGAQRKAFLMQFPELKQYWGWKDAQRKANPDLADYFGINETQTNWEMALNDVDKVLMPALLGRLAGQPLSVGANAELRRLYEMHGRGKGLTMDDFIWELAVAVGGR